MRSTRSFAPLGGASFLLFLAASLAASPASGADFDPAAGTFELDPSATLRASFDGMSGLAGLSTRVFDVTRDQKYARLSASITTVGSASFVAEDRAVEGKGALRVGAGNAVLLGDAAAFAGVAGGRVEIKMLARAEGAMPELRAIYSKKTPVEADEAAYPSAQILAIRTGRATSDGWIELSTGPVDAMISTTPLAGILLIAADDAPAGASFLVDALEVKRVDGPLLSGGECLVAKEAEQCKKGAVCTEGICIDAAVVYGALPDAETRADIVERTTTYLTRFQEDRHASDAALAGFAKEMPGVAATATDSAQFFRRYAQLVGLARGAHTGAPSPNPFSRAANGAMYQVRYRGSELNACFGITKQDLTGSGAVGYGVYRTAAQSPLRVGDVVTTIDGENADDWIARLAPQHAMLAADPDSDRPYVAAELHALVMRYAKELGLSRCTGTPAASTCDTVKVDIGQLRKEKRDAIVPLACSPRAKLAVNVPAGVDSDAYEAAIAETGADGIVTLHTNGEPLGDKKWIATVSGAFESATDKLLVDKRRGDGGGGDALETWGGYLRRGPSYGFFFVPRIDHARIDGPPGFLSDLLGTCSGKSVVGKCALAQLETYAAKPGSLPARTAWVTVLDGSASDMSTYLAKGATGVRVFGSNRTLGLFGGLGVMGAFLPGWTGGYVQLEDTRSGETNAERVAGAWHSGRGVDPDEIVVQLESDLVAGRDTMIERARAWLQGGE